MKKTILFISVLFLISCKTHREYIPVEATKTEYRDVHHRDSVFVRDSVLVKLKNDTVFLEKYHFLYRDKWMRDSIFFRDTIRIPYPVEVEREINRLTSFQSFQVWCGRIAIALLILATGGILLRKR